MKQSVLIIDDDPDIGELISVAARSFGYDCLATSDVFSFWASLSPATSIIFLDLVMPELDGIQVLRQLALQNNRARLILASGVGSRIINSAVELAEDLGLSILGSLHKPFGLAEIESLFETPFVVPPTDGTSERESDALESSELQRAIKDDEFSVYYQPYFNVTDGGVAGAVALPRWNHPVNGVSRPSQFMPRIERTGLVNAFTWHIMNRTLSECASEAWCWKDYSIPISIKVPIHALMNLEFPDRLQALMTSYCVSPEQLTIHIIEGGLLAELFGVIDVLLRLRLRGIRISVNDFGMGCSMRQQLRRLPTTELRIDKVFIMGIRGSRNDEDIVRRSVETGHELGMKTFAEGVEDLAQLEKLRKVHCDLAIGTFFARPMPSDAFKCWLHQ